MKRILRYEYFLYVFTFVTSAAFRYLFLTKYGRGGEEPWLWFLPAMKDTLMLGVLMGATKWGAGRRLLTGALCLLVSAYVFSLFAELFQVLYFSQLFNPGLWTNINLQTIPVYASDPLILFLAVAIGVGVWLSSRRLHVAFHDSKLDSKKSSKKGRRGWRVLAALTMASLVIGTHIYSDTEACKKLFHKTVEWKVLDLDEKRSKVLSSHLQLLYMMATARNATEWGKLVDSLPSTSQASPLDSFTPEEKQWIGENLDSSFRKSPSQKITEKKEGSSYRRIVLISVESLALEYLIEFNPKIPAWANPYLQSVMKENRGMTNFWTTMLPTDNALVGTYLSIPMEFLALREARAFPSLFSILKEHGYDPYLYRGTTGRWESHFSDYPNIFSLPKDHFFEEDRLVRDNPDLKEKTRGWGLPDRVVFSEAFKTLLHKKDEKVFMAINTTDTHPPYVLDDWEVETQHNDATPLLNTLNVIDKNLREFMGNMKSNGLLEDSLIIITADHTPNYGEYLDWTGKSGYEPARIPFIVVSQKSLPKEVQTDYLASEVDMMPSILDLLGIAAPVTAWGQSIFSDRPGRAISAYENAFYLRLPGAPQPEILSRFPGQEEVNAGSSPAKVRLAKWIRYKNDVLKKWSERKIPKSEEPGLRLGNSGAVAN